MKLDELARRNGEWLKGSGPESDIVISSRIRLARNLADFPFIRRCNETDRSGIEKAVRDKLRLVPEFSDSGYVEVHQLSTVDRQFLVERQLISRELADGEGPRGVLIDGTEKFSVMVNEEDHLRIQVMNSGLDLTSAWERINRIDDLVERRVTYAFSDRLGFLTACPTNVGTGMRVSVMLHLPALVLTRQIEKVFRSLQKISLAVRRIVWRRLAGDGRFLSNQQSDHAGSPRRGIDRASRRRRARDDRLRAASREFLVKESQKDLHDRVSRAYGILCTAQTISSEETMMLLSSVRMGVNLGLIEDVEIPTINQLFIHTQPAHLQKIRGMELDTADRNIERAIYLQRHLRKHKPGSDAEKN